MQLLKDAFKKQQRTGFEIYVQLKANLMNMFTCVNICIYICLRKPLNVALNTCIYMFTSTKQPQKCYDQFMSASEKTRAWEGHYVRMLIYDYSFSSETIRGFTLSVSSCSILLTYQNSLKHKVMSHKPTGDVDFQSLPVLPRDQ